MVSATASNGMQISFSVGDARDSVNAPAPADAKAPKAAPAAAPALATDGSRAPQGAPCAVRILHKSPKSKSREVATFKLKGMPADHDAMMALLKRRACEAGANALLIKKPKHRAGTPVDQVEAAALVLPAVKPAVDSKPAPKTIEVPLPSKPVPKTITVDPAA